MAIKKVIVHTDGACISNPGPGGYGIIINYEGRKKELSGGFKNTTNNRMEIMAAIAALEALREKCQVTLFSDSAYLVNAISKDWAKRWQKHGWKRNKREMAQNPDLWVRLLKACEAHDVEFRWVRGHSANPDNERCDQLANEAAVRQNLPTDEGYEKPPHRLL
jgi:ribonuclease HI